MRVSIVNPPHPSIGSRIPKEQLPPLGLLAIGGPLIDAGHDVELIDGELGDVPIDELVDRIVKRRPEALMIGHSGSTSAHPIVAQITRQVRARLADPVIIYGGVYPTYHYREIRIRSHRSMSRRTDGPATSGRRAIGG